jgi:hypothetical protein
LVYHTAKFEECSPVRLPDGQTAFASKVGCSEKTLRNFRRTGKVRRSILVEIAQAMGTTPEELVRLE